MCSSAFVSADSQLSARRPKYQHGTKTRASSSDSIEKLEALEFTQDFDRKSHDLAATQRVDSRAHPRIQSCPVKLAGDLDAVRRTENQSTWMLAESGDVLEYCVLQRFQTHGPWRPTRKLILIPFSYVLSLGELRLCRTPQPSRTRYLVERFSGPRIGVAAALLATNLLGLPI